jgi:hypothetical protein
LTAAEGAHVTIVVRVGARRDRVQQRHHSAPRAGRAGPLAQADEPVDELLDGQPGGHRRDERDPDVSDRSSSKRMPTPSSPASPSSCTMKMTS